MALELAAKNLRNVGIFLIHNVISSFEKNVAGAYVLKTSSMRTKSTPWPRPSGLCARATRALRLAIFKAWTIVRALDFLKQGASMC
jgi:hypothetical protein